MKPIALSTIIVLLNISALVRLTGIAFAARTDRASLTAPRPHWQWSSEKNLKWKTPLPGKGSSSPIISGIVSS